MAERYTSKELVDAALRVLRALAQNSRAAYKDMAIVREHVLTAEADLPIDDMASRIVEREGRKVIAEAKRERMSIQPKGKSSQNQRRATRRK